MASRVRRISTLIAVLAASAVVVPAALASERDNPPAGIPTLYVKYAMNCTFAIFDDDDKRVTSINPGTYQIEVSTPLIFKLVAPSGPTPDMAPNDYTGCRGWVQFQLAGPGVDLYTTLDYGCDAFQLLPATTFRPGATYSFTDLNQPAVAHQSVTVASSGSPPTPKSPYTPTSGKGQSSTDLVGSALRTALRGTLSGKLTANGSSTLELKGKTVSTLKAGKYKFVISDQDPKGSFTIRAVKGKSTDITGATFVGKHSKTVVLEAGRWMYTSGSGKAHYFKVI